MQSDFKSHNQGCNDGACHVAAWHIGTWVIAVRGMKKS